MTSILIVSTLRPGGTVGVQTHIIQAADLLVKRGGHVRVVTAESWLPSLSSVLRAVGAAARRTKSEAALRLYRGLNRRFLDQAARREFRAEEPAVVYAQDPRSADAALKARKSTATPVVMIVHYNESQAEELIERGLIARNGYTDRTIREFEARAIPRLDGLVFVSDFMRQHLIEKIPAARNIPSIIIPNFISDLKAPPTSGPLRDCISVGSLVERKNQQYLLHVLAAARDRGRRYTLTLAGDGPRREQLKSLAAKLGIAEQVAFLGERSDVAQLLPRHHAYVHSSLMENCPFAILEAFRAGLPVVTSHVGGIPEVIGDDGAGRFWDLADPKAGAQVLIDLLENKAVLSAAAQKARSRFETKYDATVVGNRLAEFLEQAGSKAHLRK